MSSTDETGQEVESFFKDYFLATDAKNFNFYESRFNFPVARMNRTLQSSAENMTDPTPQTSFLHCDDLSDQRRIQSCFPTSMVR